MLTTEEFRLLRSLVEWRRANGWGYTRAGRDDMWWFRKGVWRVFVYSEEYKGQEYMVLRVDDRVSMAGVTVSWPRSVEQAVDLLVAVGVLPLRFSSAYEAGRNDGISEGVDSVTEANLWALVDGEFEKLGKSPAREALAAKLSHRMPDTPWEARQMVDEIVTAVGEVLDA